MKVLYNGIDLSKHNGTIDFKKLKACKKVDYAILRAGFGKVISQKDSKFEEYYAGCKQNNIPVGAYWYSYAATVQDAIKEAETCYQCVKGKQFEFPIYFDIEDKCQIKLNKETCTAIVEAFCTALEKLGYWCGVYSMDSFFVSNLYPNVQEKYACWVARVENVQPTYCKTYGMWQYSWKGKFDGIQNETDCNYCYADYPTLIKKTGKNGYQKNVTSSNTNVTNSNIYNVPANITLEKPYTKNVITTYQNISKVVSNHFNVTEFSSKNGNTVYSDKVKIHNKLIELLEGLYAKLYCSKIIVTSGYRTAAHDKAVGGSGTGQHVLGRAADIICYDKSGKIIPAKKVCCALEDMGNVYGIGYISANATHVDTRTVTAKWWGDETCNNKQVSSFHSYFKI